MKPLAPVLLISLLFTTVARAQFSGSVSLINAYGTEGSYDSTSFSFDRYENTSSSGFFHGLNLDSYNNTQNEDGSPGGGEPMSYNPEITSNSGAIIVADVNPENPVNDLITFFGRYEFSLTSISFESPYEKYGNYPSGYFVGTGEITDTLNEIPSALVDFTIDFEGETDGLGPAHVPSEVTLDIVPEPPSSSLLAIGCLELAMLAPVANRFFRPDPQSP